MKSIEIKIPIYFGTLIIVSTDNLEELNPFYNTKIDDSLYDAVFFEAIERDEFIIAIKVVEWSIIAHEVVHMVNSLFASRGIELDRINDEPQAYFTGWVTGEIDKFLKEIANNHGK
jgi:hypothetical protein